MHQRNFGSHVTVRPTDRPSVRTTAIWQLEVILAGNRIATSVLGSRDNYRANKDENGKRKLFLYLCCLKYEAQSNCHVHKFGIRERERKRNRESRRQASEAQREKERQTATARHKWQRGHFLLEEQHGNFVAATKVKMSGSEKEN